MGKAKTYSWQGGGMYFFGKCDVENCVNKPKWKYFYSPTCMNGDDECLISLCGKHEDKKEKFVRSLTFNPTNQ